MLQFIEKYPIATIFAVIVLMLLVHLNVPNVTIMEARNFITAREMVQDHNWLLTTMNGEARYEKPPLPTWLSAFSGLILGINNIFALRLPAALMVLFLGIFLYLLSLKLNLTKLHSFYNALIVITSFYIFAIINEAPWDIFAHGFMFAGLYYLVCFFKENYPWKNAVLAGIFMGLSIMSKGPVSLFALLLPFVISYAFVFRFKKFTQNILPFITFIIIMFSLGSWWFVCVRIADSQAFLEIATKETSNWSSYNVKPFYYYWSFFTQTGIWTIPAFISLLYPYLIKRIKHKTTYKFTFWWTISAVILLSLIPEKKPRYLVPVLIPLALNTGFYINYLIKKFKNISAKKEVLPVYFNFGLIGVIAFIVPIALFILLKEDVTNYLLNFILTTIASITSCLLIIKNLFKKNIKNVFYTVLFFMVTLFLFGMPISKHFTKNKLFKPISSLHKFEKQNNITSYSFNELSPEIIWDYNGKIKNIFQNNVLTIPSEKNFGLLLQNKDIDLITKKLGTNYNLKLVETYNLNFGSKNKERLIRQFYIVSKKQ
jgi:4-amino-4-deoxy-L-arabinose transferase-like glycosyltransferase